MNTQSQNILNNFRFVFILLVAAFAVGQSLPVQAEEILLDRAASGDAAAQFELGRYYGEKAQSLEDFRKAYFWMKKAAEQGMGKAQFFVADMYCSGSGVIQSYIDAYAWHSLAAQKGVTAAEEKMEIMEQLFLTPDDMQRALKIVSGVEKRSKE